MPVLVAAGEVLKPEGYTDHRRALHPQPSSDTYEITVVEDRGGGQESLPEDEEEAADRINEVDRSRQEENNLMKWKTFVGIFLHILTVLCMPVLETVFQIHIRLMRYRYRSCKNSHYGSESKLFKKRTMVPLTN